MALKLIKKQKGKERRGWGTNSRGVYSDVL